MSAFTRMLRRHGETWTLNSWAGSSRDEYEDELAIDPLVKTFRAIRSDSGEDETETRDEKGQTRFEKLELLVEASLELPESSELPPLEVTDAALPVTMVSPDGREFSLIGVAKSGLPLGSKRLMLRSGGQDAAVYF